jgi:hypothetical protein
MKTIVGSFDNFEAANRVARELIDDGFRDSDVSVIASNVRGQFGNDVAASGAGYESARADTSTTVRPGVARPDAALIDDGGGRVEPARVADDASGAATGAVTGGVVGGAAGLAASLMGLAIPGIGPIIAAGPIVATLTGAGVGAVAGGLIGGLTDMGVSRPDAEYYAESVRRGGALVTVRADDARADRAADIMRAHGAIDIEGRAEQWRTRGWTGFDESAKPYTPEELDKDRDMYGATDRVTGMGGGMSTGGPTVAAPGGSIPDRGTAGSTAERITPRPSGARTY